ncbi:MAG: HAMP domain-containing protein [Candidatus Obscuribacterales bacterium]|nr:HAMP domain-containing protein [Candidatus Obscuribacterales bacterium]
MFLLITFMVVGLISVLTYCSLSAGFSAYLSKSELSSIDAIPQLLAEEYEQKGSWKNVFSDSEIMNRILANNEDMAGAQNRRAPPPDFAPPEHLRPEDRPPFPPFRIELFKRIGIFDLEKKLLWGNESARNSQAELPIKLADGSQIASLRLQAAERVSKDLESAFVAEQSRNLVLVSLVAVILATAAALLLSKDIVDAVRILEHGTKRLNEGDLAARIDLQRSDELGRLAQDFNILAANLEIHDRAHKQWIADTSHELRTPVAVLRAQVEALQDGVQEANPRTLQVLHDEVMSLGKLIDDLYDLARFDVKQLNFHLLPTEIASVLQDTVDSFAERFQQKRITLDNSKTKDLKSLVKADSSRLKQLFANLLENSLRYTEEGGRLEISSKTEVDFLILNFADSAPGVPEELVLRIFERFYRLESSRSREYGGSGLGLAICKTIVESHGGSIVAGLSDLGGLKIEVKLPIYAAEGNSSGQ